MQKTIMNQFTFFGILFGVLLTAATTSYGSDEMGGASSGGGGGEVEYSKGDVIDCTVVLGVESLQGDSQKTVTCLDSSCSVQQVFELCGLSE